MNRKSNEEAGDGRGGRGAAWQWAAAAVMIYLLPFVLVLIDEKVLKTFWLYHHLHLPDGAAEVLRAIYPFYRWFK